MHMDLNTLKQANTAKILPSKLAPAILELKGKKLDLSEYKPFELLYDIAPPKLTLQCGRQIGKSVYLAGQTIIQGILRPHFVTLFISPLAQQTSRFSTAYLDAFFNGAIIKRHFTDAASKKNVFEKTLTTGARMILGYSQTEQDADRIRGVAADALYCDEMQDISMDSIAILAETLGASEHAFIRHTGTAKTENNSLNILFKRSNGLEWVVKCTSCGKYNIPHDFDTCEKMTLINPDGPGCIHCGTLLDMKTGQWLAARPNEKDHIGAHIPQICVPARNRPKKWKELVNKSRDYPPAKLANEVYGLPAGLGGRPITMKEAMMCCNPLVTKFDTGFPVDGRNIVLTTLGVDWSTTSGDKSYTVISILGYDWNGRCYLLYSQRLNGVDILEQVKRVQELYYQYKCSVMASDRGVGVLQGQILQRNIGTDKVAMVNYVSAKTQLRWDKEGIFYAADRTMNIDTMVVKMKMGSKSFETPSWDIMSGFWEDALSIFDEESQSGKRLYRKDEDACDDWLHSVVFANIAFMVAKGDFTYIDKDANNDTFVF